MQRKLILAFDMDDTLVDTYGFIYAFMLQFYTDRGMQTELDYIMGMHKKGHSSLQWSKWVSDDVYYQIIKKHSYMVDVKPTALLSPEFISMCNNLIHVYPEVIEFVICTHRGFTSYGKPLTEEWLEENKVNHIFKTVHALDRKNNANKIAFLQKEYPGCEIRLVDDNPMHDGEVVHPHMPELIIYDKITALPGYANQNKWMDNAAFLNNVTQLVKDL